MWSKYIKNAAIHCQKRSFMVVISKRDIKASNIREPDFVCIPPR